MWFARDYTKSLKGKNKNQTLPMRAKRSFVVIVAAALLWMTGTQPIASVTRSSRQTTSKPRSGAPQKPGLPRPSQPSNTPLRAKFHFMKNAAGNGILQCDTSTGTVKRVTPSTAIPPAGATGQYMFVVFGAEDIKACNVITGNCYTAPKSVN